MADFFCLDLGETQIRVGGVEHKGKLFEVSNMGFVDVDPLFYRTDSEKVIEKTANSILKTLEQLKIKKKEARVIIPDSFTYNRFIEMPQLNEKELLSAIRYQADQFIPMSLDEINLDIEVINEDINNRKTLVFLSAAPKTIIAKVKSLLEYADLFPESIEPETSAIARFLSEIYKNSSAKSSAQFSQSTGFVLINLNLSSTSVYFFDQGLGLMTYSHNFSSGYSTFLKQIQVNLNVDPRKAEELLKSFGTSQNSSYNLSALLAPSLKASLTEFDRSIKEVIGKNKSHINNIFLAGDALKFHSLDSIIGKFFALPTAYFDLAPYFVKNSTVEFFKNDLTYFLAWAGGALR